eukprot:8992595-Pyramimonas_sp.AAC.1
MNISSPQSSATTSATRPKPSAQRFLRHAVRGGATRVARLGTGMALGSSPGFRFRLRSLFLRLLITRRVLQMAFLEQPHVRVAAA